MRPAPPVSVRCTGGRAWRAVQTLLPALAAGAFAFWMLSPAEAKGLPLVLAGCAAALAAALAWRLSRPTEILLSWDGQRWAGDGLVGRLDVMIDLGSWLLLRLRPEPLGRSCWIAVAAGEAGAAMHTLRAAAYALAPLSEDPLRATGSLPNV